MKAVASPAPPAARSGGLAAPFVAAFFAAALLALLGAAALNGARPARFDPSLAPGPLSAVAFAVGWLVLVGARRLHAERWTLLLAGIVAGASAFAPTDVHRTLVWAVVPLLAGAYRPSLASAFAGLLAGGFVGGLLGSRWPQSEPIGTIICGAGVAAVAPFLLATTPPLRARFDLRAALALASVLLFGLVLGFGLTTLEPYGHAPASYGGAGLSPKAGPGLSFVLALVPTSLLAGYGTHPIRTVLSFAVAVAGAALLLIPLAATFWIGLCLLSAGLAYAALAGARRASRAARGWSILLLGLSTLGGMNLAPALVRAFSKPLPGLLVVDGAEVAQRTQWPLVIGFFLALTLVVGLAHLAFAYEFGLPPLDPDDSTDPLPIKRKGLQRPAKTA